MITKWHVNSSRKVSQCKAEKRNCPFLHFDTEKEAKTHVNKLNSQEYLLFPKLNEFSKDEKIDNENEKLQIETSEQKEINLIKPKENLQEITMNELNNWANEQKEIATKARDLIEDDLMIQEERKNNNLVDKEEEEQSFLGKQKMKLKTFLNNSRKSLGSISSVLMVSTTSFVLLSNSIKSVDVPPFVNAITAMVSFAVSIAKKIQHETQTPNPGKPFFTTLTKKERKLRLNQFNQTTNIPEDIPDESLNARSIISKLKENSANVAHFKSIPEEKRNEAIKLINDYLKEVDRVSFVWKDGKSFSSFNKLEDTINKANSAKEEGDLNLAEKTMDELNCKLYSIGIGDNPNHKEGENRTILRREKTMALFKENQRKLNKLTRNKINESDEEFEKRIKVSQENLENKMKKLLDR